MASQKSTPITAIEPKRQRGRLRVAAILDAAATLFVEKGYDAATMTEIAARANTAIGSLYRFFPTKEVLADALLTRYCDLVIAALDGLAGRAAGLSAGELADALIDLKLALHPERAAALVLVDARAVAPDMRFKLRDTLRSRIATILMTAIPALLPARANAMAVLLQHLMKALAVPPPETATAPEDLIAEVRAVARLYIASVMGEG